MALYTYVASLGIEISWKARDMRDEGMEDLLSPSDSFPLSLPSHLSSVSIVKSTGILSLFP